MRQVYITVVAIVCLSVLGALGWVLLKYSPPKDKAAIVATQASPGAATLPDASRVAAPEQGGDDPETEAAAAEKAIPVVIRGSIAEHAAAIPDVDEKLVSWLSDWEKRNKSGKEATAAQYAELKSILATTALPYAELFGIGDAAGPVPTSDSRAVAALFYEAAVRAAQKNLATLSPRGDAARLYNFHMHQMWNKMNGFIDGVTWETIWRIQFKFDSPGSDDAAGSERMLGDSLLKRSYESDNPELAQAALDGLNSMLNRDGGNAFTPEQKSKICGSAARCLMMLNDNAGAVPVLQYAIDHSTGNDTVYYGEQLIAAQIATGDLAGARLTLGQLETAPGVNHLMLGHAEFEVKLAENLRLSKPPENQDP